MGVVVKSGRGWALFASAPLLADAAVSASGEDDNAPRWVQIASEGLYKGHPAGPFELNDAVFKQVVANFRRHPDFKAGDDGWGMSRVIPFDFHHASEQDPSRVAVHGAPAQAWALDLDVRADAAGKATLWALTEYLEPMRTYAREGRYKSTSVSLWPDAVDPITAQPIGWYLSSIAFTNDPFIQGMIPIEAARTCKCPGILRAKLMAFVAAADAPAATEPEQTEGSDAAAVLPEDEAKVLEAYPWDECVPDQLKAGHSQEAADKICGYIKEKFGANAVRATRTGTATATKLDMGWYQQAGSQLEAIESMRRMLRIPATGDLGAELGKVAAMIAGGTVPPGVELDDVIEALRCILGLPVLTAGGEVVQEAMRVAAAVTAARRNETGQTAASRAPSCGEGRGTPTQTKGFAIMNEFLKILAERFGIPTDEKKVQERVLAELAGGAAAQEALNTVLGLLGSTDLEAARAKVQEFKAAVAALELVLPELKAMGEEAMAAEDAAAVADVKQVMQTTRVPDTMRDALVLERTGGIQLTDEKRVSEVLKARRTARDAFQKKHGVNTASAPAPDAADVPAYLTTAVATLAVPTASAPLGARTFSASNTAPATAEAAPGAHTALMAQIEAATGVNITQKAMNLVRSRPGSDKLTYDQVHLEACKLIAAARAK